MGWKIVVTDEIPADLPDFKEKPYRSEIWIDSNLVTEIPPQRQLKTEQPASQPASASSFKLNNLRFVYILAAFIVAVLREV